MVCSLPCPVPRTTAWASERGASATTRPGSTDPRPPLTAALWPDGGHKLMVTGSWQVGDSDGGFASCLKPCPLCLKCSHRKKAQMLPNGGNKPRNPQKPVRGSQGVLSLTWPRGGGQTDPGRRRERHTSPWKHQAVSRGQREAPEGGAARRKSHRKRLGRPETHGHFLCPSPRSRL